VREEIAEIKEITEEREVIVGRSATCNKCGKTYKQNHDSDDYMGHYDGLWDGEIHNFGASFGYASSYDEESWDFDLCEDCLVDFIKTFKHVPDGFREERSYIIIKDREEHQKIFDNWKETGEWEDLKYKTYDELANDYRFFRTEHLNDVIKKYHPGKPLLDDTDMEKRMRRSERLLGLKDK
jgi:hypothetical protein